LAIVSGFSYDEIDTVDLSPNEGLKFTPNSLGLCVVVLVPLVFVTSSDDEKCRDGR
jgi:hypothetical protein